MNLINKLFDYGLPAWNSLLGLGGPVLFLDALPPTPTGYGWINIASALAGFLFVFIEKMPKTLFYLQRTWLELKKIGKGEAITSDFITDTYNEPKANMESKKEGESEKVGE